LRKYNLKKIGLYDLNVSNPPLDDVVVFLSNSIQLTRKIKSLGESES